MKRKITALILITILTTTLLSGCFVGRVNHRIEAEEQSDFYLKDDTINRAFINLDTIMCLVNSNEIRAYSEEGELLDSEMLDSEAKDFIDISEGFYAVLMENGDVYVIRSFLSNPINIRYTAHFDKQVIDVSARDQQTKDADIYWFVTSDHELYGAGLNANNCISEDESKDTIIWEPVRIRDDIQGIYKWIGADDESNLFNLVTGEEVKGDFLIFNDELVTSQEQFTLYTSLKRAEKKNPELLENISVGSVSSMYEDDGEFYYSGFAHETEHNNMVSVKDKKVDIPGGYNYCFGTEGKIVCYDEHKIIVYYI